MTVILKQRMHLTADRRPEMSVPLNMGYSTSLEYHHMYNYYI